MKARKGDVCRLPVCVSKASAPVKGRNIAFHRSEYGWNFFIHWNRKENRLFVRPVLLYGAIDWWPDSAAGPFFLNPVERPARIPHGITREVYPGVFPRLCPVSTCIKPGIMDHWNTGSSKKRPTIRRCRSSAISRRWIGG